MPPVDLAPAAGVVRRLLDGVRDDRLHAPTPCEGIPVAGLLDHFMGLCLAFTWAARKTPPVDDGRRPGQADADALDPQWRILLPQRLSTLVEAWAAPGAWEGTARAGGVEAPAEMMGVVALDELVLHGWDLARATGQPFSCDPASTAAVLAFTRSAATVGRSPSRPGLFGAAVPVPDDAPELDRALGYAGRDPRWSPTPLA